MGTLKKFDNITKAQIAANGVQALADRPNSTGSYGVGGLSAADLKKWFDRLAELLAERINTVHSTLSSDDAAKYIRIALDESGVDSMSALVDSFLSGAFSAKILKVYPSVSAGQLMTLQQAIYSLVTRAELKDLTDEFENTIKEGKEVADATDRLFHELEDRLKADNIGDDTLKRHNENMDAHKALFGEGNKRGINGFWIAEVDTTNNRLRLSPNTSRTAFSKPTIVNNLLFDNSDNIRTGYEVGDEFSVITPKDHYIRCGKITEMHNNILAFEPYVSVNWDAGYPKDNCDYSFSVPMRAGVGIIDVFKGGLAEGKNTRAGGDWTHSEGLYSQAVGAYSHAEGLATGSGYAAHSEGAYSMAIQKYSHSEGFTTTASGEASHSEGHSTEASGFAGHAEGYKSKAVGHESHAEGYETQATNRASHAEGRDTVASGESSHAEGYGTTAYGLNSHAEGEGTTANGTRSHAEGLNTTTSGKASHAEGERTTASGNASHAEGQGTTSYGLNSHAEGEGTTANGTRSHAEGLNTTTSGKASHAEGEGTTASGNASHAGGIGTIASAEAQTVIGKYNKENPDALLIVGNGTSDADRSNAFEVLDDGTILTPCDPIARVVTGSYVGSGKSSYYGGGDGSGNVVSLTFDFVPKQIIITMYDFIAVLLPASGTGTCIRRNNTPFTDAVGGTFYLTDMTQFGVELDGNTITARLYEINESGVKYCYTAIG